MRKPALSILTGSLAVVATGALGGCLTRPVSSQQPETKTNFTTEVQSQAVDKIDLLLAIDNSKSMGDKQAFLAEAVPQLVKRLVTPNCINTAGEPVGQSTLDEAGEGVCPEGSEPEFKPIVDIHIGIVSSSLGTFGAGSQGSQICENASTVQDPNDRALLVKRGQGANVQTEASNFLAWFPPVTKNDNKQAPGAGYSNADELSNSFAALVQGVGENGCGFEAQLESVYQFLVAPDPWNEIVIEDNRARYEGINEAALRQRRDFLRPDSLVAVIMLTDEEDSSVDPLAVGGAGWRFMSNQVLPRGTSACFQEGPGAPDCTSCAYDESAPGCAAGDVAWNGAVQRDKINFNGPVQNANEPGGEDELNVRFFDMKLRFGVDPQYPIQRYSSGFTRATVPSRDAEHGGAGNYGGYDVEAGDCVNPLFATNLPSSAADEWCKLDRGGRSSRLVFFALVGGVPNDLLSEQYRDPKSGQVTSEGWTKILGNDPLKYDRGGIDERMRPSISVRDGRPGPGAPDAEGADPDNNTFRDWDTKKRDLQYACTFPIPQNLQKPIASDGDCKINSDAPLCADNNTSVARVQVRAKAFPTVREIQVVKQLGAQGILSSLCPRVTEGNQDSPAYGYNPAVNEIVDRLKNALTNQCLPQKLTKDANGEVSCLMLEVLPEGQNSCTGIGRNDPDPELAAKFRETLPNDLKARTLCEFPQQTASVASECKDGWCYLEGEAAGTCAQSVVFDDLALSRAKNAEGVSSIVYLQCINTSAPGVGSTPAEEPTDGE